MNEGKRGIRSIERVRIQRGLGFSLIALLFVGLILGFSIPTSAHAQNDGFVIIDAGQETFDVSLYLPAETLYSLYPQLEEARYDMEIWNSYVAANLGLSVDGQPLLITLIGMEERTQGGINYAVVELSSPREPGTSLSVDYRFLIDDGDPEHRSVIYFMEGDALLQSAVDARERTLEFPLSSPASGWETFKSFFVLGVEHIAAGWDHLLYLLVLIVAASRFGFTLLITAVFGISHSISYLLVSLGIVNAPPWVEAAIALTILYAAIENFWQRPVGWRMVSPFLFGLVHGMGFAGAIQEVGGTAGGTIVPVAAFNLGIEAGQLAIASAMYALILLIRKRVPGKMVTAALSSLVGIAALVLTFDRLTMQ